MLTFIEQEWQTLLTQTLDHVWLTFASLFCSMLLGIPLGITVSRYRGFAPWVLGISGVLQTIPSIALLGFMIPLIGIGQTSAIVALLLYALLPIVRNTYTGITGVSADTVEAANGMGMTSSQILIKVQLPLALPVIFAGIRTATVINVGVATLAAYIAAGGLGEFIFKGLALNNPNMILAGALPAAMLAILLDQFWAAVQRLHYHYLWRVLLAVFIGLPLITLLFWLWPKDSGVVLKAGFAHEFTGREDGYKGLQKVYGLDLQPLSLNNSLMYQALAEGEIDIISGYSTDGRIKALGLRVLEDDKKAFPPYQCAPIIRQDVLKRFPEIKKVLGQLSGLLTDSVMTALNYKVDQGRQPMAKVADDFLRSYQLSGNAAPTKGKIIIGSKIFTEQYILAEIFAQLIKGQLGIAVELKTGLGGTKICFEALLAGEIDLYPEYSGTGLLVMLQPSEKEMQTLMRSESDLFDHVAGQFLEQFNIVWLSPLGFNNTYALMMRKAQAEKWQIERISDLPQNGILSTLK